MNRRELLKQALMLPAIAAAVSPARGLTKDTQSTVTNEADISRPVVRQHVGFSIKYTEGEYVLDNLLNLPGRYDTDSLSQYPYAAIRCVGVDISAAPNRTAEVKFEIVDVGGMPEVILDYERRVGFRFSSMPSGGEWSLTN